MVFRTVLCAAALAAALPLPADARTPPNAQTAGLQVALRAKHLYAGPVDAIRGPATAQAVHAFQLRAGLAPDGVAGAQTRAALGPLGRPLFGNRTIVRGDVGWDVSVLQFLLRRAGQPRPEQHLGEVIGGAWRVTGTARQPIRMLNDEYGAAPDFRETRRIRLRCLKTGAAAAAVRRTSAQSCPSMILTLTSLSPMR